jgi:O-antigen ligase
MFLFAGIIDVNIGPINISMLAIRINLLLISIAFLIYSLKYGINRLQISILIIGFLLLTVQIAGLFIHSDKYSFSTIIMTVLIFIYISFTVGIDYSKLNLKAYKALYYILLFGLLIDSYFNKSEFMAKYFIGGNTLGGSLVFLTLINIIINFYDSLINKTTLPRLGNLSIFMIIPLLMFTRARTAIMIAVLFILFYIFISMIKLKGTNAINFFWIIIITSIIGSFFYSQFTTYSFYGELNAISLQLFGKHIDSSRPWLWRESLNALEGNWLLGLGTGIVATDVINFEGSFHNQFLQLLMQNGIVGLSLLYILLFVLWRQMAENLNNKLVRICAAALLAVIVYNCFETTLLQNKLALGIIQWQLITIGTSKARILGLKNNINKV